MRNPTSVAGTFRLAWGFAGVAAALLALPPLLRAAEKGPATTAPGAQRPQPLRIMCVGDSITAGYTDNPAWNVPFQFGYRAALYQRLTREGYAVQFVGASPEPWNGAFGKPRNTPAFDLRPLGQDAHRGYGGWNTGGILAKIEGWLAEDKPDVVLLMIGINDGGSPAARDNLRRIAQTIVARCPRADLIVAQITPTVNVSQSILDYNAFIRDTLVPELRGKGGRVSTVDQYKNLLTRGRIDSRLFSNGLNHPNATAYARMAQTWLEGIQAVRPLEKAAGPGGVAAIVQEWRGFNASGPGARRVVARDAAAWQAVWADMMGNVVPVPEAPKVDFARHQVVAAFMGQRNTGGYSIKITRVEAGERIVVHVKESSPPPDAMVTMALTAPYHTVVIPRSDKPVEFVSE